MNKNKFNIGDKVHCFRKGSHFDFDFIGKVYAFADTGSEISPEWEYHVSNAPMLWDTNFPLLIWEHEMEKING